MQNVLLTIHLIACIALVIAVMLQRSEGGALGMGGGGTGGLISGRGAAGVLVRTTMILAGVFFVTSIIMTRLNNDTSSQPSLLERQAGETSRPLRHPEHPACGAGPRRPQWRRDDGPRSAAPRAPRLRLPLRQPQIRWRPRRPLPRQLRAAPAPATPAPTTTTPAPENGGSPTP